MAFCRLPGKRAGCWSIAEENMTQSAMELISVNGSELEVIVQGMGEPVDRGLSTRTHRRSNAGFGIIRLASSPGSFPGSLVVAALPRPGEVPLNKITTALVREWRATLIAGGLSQTMAAQAYRLLSFRNRQ